MIPGGKIITVLVVVLLVGGLGYADMMPVSDPQGAQPPAARTEDWTNPPGDEGCCPLLGYGLADLEWEGVRFLPVRHVDGESGGASRPLYILASRDNSLGLCLYALLSLGLCRAVPSIRRLSIGVVPDWFSCGGPFQIGHSHAISPDCLCPATVCCFIQPNRDPEDPAPQYRREIIVSLRRKSQFTPTTLAPRGPPSDDRPSSVA